MPEMTIIEYAHHQGVNRKTVTRWKRDGYLVFCKSGKIDSGSSDERLDSFGLGKIRRELKETIYAETPAMGHSIHGSPLSGDVQMLEVNLLPTADAENLKENYLALLRKLEFEKKAGKLVEAEPVRKMMFELWRRERDSLLNLPSRISAVIAAELGVDQNRLTILLEKEINEYLQERADQPPLRFS